MISNLKKVAIGAFATAGLLFYQVALGGLMHVQLVVPNAPSPPLPPFPFDCADNIAGSTTCDVNSLPNQMTVIAGVGGVPAIPGYNVSVTTTFSNNPGTPGFNILDLTWSVASLGLGGDPLTILVSQQDFLFPSGSSNLQSVCSGDALNATVTCQEWVNLNNTLFGLGPITPGAQGPFSAPFTSTALSGPYLSVPPYSITDRLIFTLGPNGTSTGDLRSITPVPEPATIALVGVALLGLGVMRRRKELKTDAL